MAAHAAMFALLAVIRAIEHDDLKRSWLGDKLADRAMRHQCEQLTAPLGPQHRDWMTAMTGSRSASTHRWWTDIDRRTGERR